MPQIRLRKLRRRLGLYEPPAPPPKPMDSASIRQRRSVFETLPAYPACPEGWRTGAPDFVIFGAQKSGTTWWFRLIEQHPGVVQPAHQRPELHFFDRLWAEWPADEAIERYHRYFPRPPGKLIGEKTPEYLSCPWAPPMVKLAAPEARAIVLLRDPVARYISGLSHYDRGGMVEEEDGLERAFGDRLRVVTDAISRGMYATQLEWLMEAYPADRLLVLQYERCASDAAGQLARTYAFLGLAAAQAASGGAGSTAEPGQAGEGRRARGAPRAAASLLSPGGPAPSRADAGDRPLPLAGLRRPRLTRGPSSPGSRVAYGSSAPRGHQLQRLPIVADAQAETHRPGAKTDLGHAIAGQRPGHRACVAVLRALLLHHGQQDRWRLVGP